MKKFIIAVIVVVIAVVLANKASAELNERSMRSVERSIAVESLAEGLAPMQQECERAGEMVFRVDPDTGITRCQGVAGSFEQGFKEALQSEVEAMALMNKACANNNGVMVVVLSLYSDSTTEFACTESRFARFWAGK